MIELESGYLIVDVLRTPASGGKEQLGGQGPWGACLRLGTAAPEKTPWGAAMIDFAEAVADLSDGRITVLPAFNSELGDEPTMARQLPRGRLDMANAYGL